MKTKTMNNIEKTNYQIKLKQMTMEFNLPKDQSSIIKVIGVGGGGSNAVNHMFEKGIRGVNYIVCNTDQQALDLSPVHNKVQLGPEITQGLGAGSLPEIGEKATLESEEEIRSILSNNTKMCFVTAGMGGGTGTGGAPVVAQIAKDMGILTVGIVTTPFSFEGRRKLLQADEGIKRLKASVDALIVVSNDKIREMYGDLGNEDAFAKADEVLLNGAKSISEIITIPGRINVDFADVEYVMKNSGIAIMGTGVAEGNDRALRAVQTALNSPLLDNNNITGAKNILINLSSGLAQVSLDEITEISNYVQDAAGNETDIIFGTSVDETLGDKLSITLIATGFEKKIVDHKPVKKEVVPLETFVAKEPEPTVTLFEETEEPTLKNEPELKQNNTFDFDFTSPKVEVEQEMFLKEKEVPAEEPKLSFYTSSDNHTPKVQEKESPKNEEFVSHKERLRALSYKWDSKQKDLEDVPAYMRRGVNLDDVEDSSTNNNSKYTLDSFDADGERKPEIRKNNRFLDDNVD